MAFNGAELLSGYGIGPCDTFLGSRLIRVQAGQLLDGVLQCVHFHMRIAAMDFC